MVVSSLPNSECKEREERLEKKKSKGGERSWKVGETGTRDEWCGVGSTWHIVQSQTKQKHICRDMKVPKCPQYGMFRKIFIVAPNSDSLTPVCTVKYFKNTVKL